MKIYVVVYDDIYGYSHIKGLFDTFSDAVDNVVENNGLDIHEVYDFEEGDTEDSVKEQLKRDIRERLYTYGETNFECANYSIREYDRDKWLTTDKWRVGYDSHDPDEMADDELGDPVETAAVQTEEFDMEKYMSKRF